MNSPVIKSETYDENGLNVGDSEMEMAIMNMNHFGSINVIPDLEKENKQDNLVKV